MFPLGVGRERDYYFTVGYDFALAPNPPRSVRRHCPFARGVRFIVYQLSAMPSFIIEIARKSIARSKCRPFKDTLAAPLRGSEL